jgi:hypothetical protein
MMRVMAMILCVALFALWDIGYNRGHFTEPVVYFAKYRMVR